MQKKLTWKSAICLAQALVLVIPAAPAFAAETKTITCDSREFTRERCNIDNSSVRLKRQLSASSCREGRDWGHDRKGIWVDNGCEAEFEVTQDGGSSKLSKGETAAAVIIGGLLLGALMTGDDGEKKKPVPAAETNNTAPPNWAWGTFRGPNPYSQVSEDLVIDRNGKVTAIRQGQPYAGQWHSGSRLTVLNESYQVERAGSSIRLTHPNGQSSAYFLIDAQASAITPNWAWGTFRGPNPYSQVREDLIIDRSGKVTAIRQGQPYAGQWHSGNRLTVLNESYQVERVGSGIRLVHPNGQSSGYFLLD
jgi:hypothetical protein